MHSIDEANRLALSKMLSAKPLWIDIKYAHEVINGMDKHTIFHAGPPITFERMCNPMKNAVIAALKYEGIAGDDEEAYSMASRGEIKFSPNHHHGIVGPMTGITSYSMPLFVIKNVTDGNIAYSTICEGMGQVLRFGSASDAAIDRLRWIEGTLAPVLKKAVKLMGGLSINEIMSQALHMGDELHMRNNAATALYIKTILPYITEVCEDKKDLIEIFKFLTNNNDQFFLNLAMAGCKSAADAAHGIENSTIVTAIARNGVEAGIRVSGLKDEWFTSKASKVKGLYFSGFSDEDANPDMGDSAILETCGLGGFAMAASPAIASFLGTSSYEDAVNNTMDMFEISVEENKQFTMPNLDFKGTPTGIDIRKVILSGITPIINTAVAGKKPGTGMIGAGISTIPLEAFEKALYEFYEKVQE